MLRRMLNVAVRKKLLFANLCAGVEFPARVNGWSVQQKIEFSAPEYLRNIIRIITETGLRVYKERVPMRKEHLDLENAMVWIPAMRIQTFIKNRSRQFGVSRYEGQVSGISGSTTYVRPTRSRLSAGGVADELTQLLRQGDAKVFKKTHK